MRNIKIIELDEWDILVTNTYKKIYSFQQQRGHQPRGVVEFTVPINNNQEESEMHENIPEIVNGDVLGVKFKTWLKRSPTETLKPTDSEIRKDWFLKEYVNDKDMISKMMPDWIEFFWHRNFYPCLQTLANDLYNRGLLEKGDYAINIDW